VVLATAVLVVLGGCFVRRAGDDRSVRSVRIELDSNWLVATKSSSSDLSESTNERPSRCSRPDLTVTDAWSALMSSTETELRQPPHPLAVDRSSPSSHTLSHAHMCSLSGRIERDTFDAAVQSSPQAISMHQADQAARGGRRDVGAHSIVGNHTRRAQAEPRIVQSRRPIEHSDKSAPLSHLTPLMAPPPLSPLHRSQLPGWNSRRFRNLASIGHYWPPSAADWSPAAVAAVAAKNACAPCGMIKAHRARLINRFDDRPACCVRVRPSRRVLGLSASESCGRVRDNKWPGRGSVRADGHATGGGGGERIC
jgi:hypothetical protein